MSSLLLNTGELARVFSWTIGYFHYTYGPHSQQDPRIRELPEQSWKESPTFFSTKIFTQQVSECVICTFFHCLCIHLLLEERKHCEDHVTLDTLPRLSLSPMALGHQMRNSGWVYDPQEKMYRTPVGKVEARDGRSLKSLLDWQMQNSFSRRKLFCQGQCSLPHSMQLTLSLLNSLLNQVAVGNWLTLDNLHTE